MLVFVCNPLRFAQTLFAEEVAETDVLLLCQFTEIIVSLSCETDLELVHQFNNFRSCNNADSVSLKIFDVVDQEGNEILLH